MNNITITNFFNYFLSFRMSLEWVTVSNGKPPKNAFVGFEDGEKKLFVARGEYNDGLHPCKFVYGNHCAYLSWGGVEHKCDDCEVLLNDIALFWKKMKVGDGELPEEAVQVGYEDGGPLYSARARVGEDNNWSIGKYSRQQDEAYFPDHDVEHVRTDGEIEVLCYKEE